MKMFKKGYTKLVMGVPDNLCIGLIEDMWLFPSLALRPPQALGHLLGF